VSGQLTRPASPLATRILAGLFVLLASVALPSVVRAACTVSATGVSFGVYDVFTATPDDSTGTITYRCGNSDKNITITLSKGGSGTYAPRKMSKAGSTDQLSYNVYFDATRTTVWGDGTGGSTYYSRNNPQNNQDVVLTMYGRITASQDVSVGSYGDTLLVTINF